MSSRPATSLPKKREALVNTVNCVGVMGRGIALQFKKSFPENFEAYAAACKRNEVQPGQMFVFETGQLFPNYIINFPTKRHWRGKSRMEEHRSWSRRVGAGDQGTRYPLNRHPSTRQRFGWTGLVEGTPSN